MYWSLCSVAEFSPNWLNNKDKKPITGRGGGGASRFREEKECRRKEAPSLTERKELSGQDVGGAVSSGGGIHQDPLLDDF